MRIWRVPREWPGQTAFIVGGGSSVASQRVERLRGRNVIAINSSWRTVPFAQYLFFVDLRWYRHNEVDLADFKGRVVTCTPCPAVVGVDPLFLQRQDISFGLASDPGKIVAGRTSTQGAIGLAAHLGAKRIVLLGIDLCKGPDGSTHHHAPHPWPHRPGSWADHVHDLAYSVTALKKVNIEVVNASPISKLNLWPTVDLEDELCREPCV